MDTTTVGASTHGAATPSVAAVLGALGVVFGDIGTSPLYALKEAATAASHGGVLTSDSVLGVLSLILWSLIVVIAIKKYCTSILRADNHGEGGIIALLALLDARSIQSGTWRIYLLMMGLVGTALLYADGTITPAISVLSAVEGLTVDAPQFERLVVPITVAILAGLFLIHSLGTGWIGRIFGPFMLLWFTVLGLPWPRWAARSPRRPCGRKPTRVRSC